MWRCIGRSYGQGQFVGIPWLHVSNAWNKKKTVNLNLTCEVSVNWFQCSRNMSLWHVISFSSIVCQQLALQEMVKVNINTNPASLEAEWLTLLIDTICLACRKLCFYMLEIKQRWPTSMSYGRWLSIDFKALETSPHGMPQHFHFLFVNDSLCQSAFRATFRGMMRVEMNTNSAGVEEGWLRLLPGITCLACCELLFLKAWNQTKMANLKFVWKVSVNLF